MNPLILYVDDDLLVANKPAGLATVPGGWEQDVPSLLQQLEQEFGRLWIVHRLDRVTSGVIVFARKAEVHRTLSMLFESREVHKIYHAIVCGIPPWDEHTARHPLRFDVGHNHRTMVDHSRGKPSETAFRVLERYPVFSLLEARPGTGRTHQVRVHASLLGFPLLGDRLYGSQDTDLIARPALHAQVLEFEFDGRPNSFTAPYPDDFKAALHALRSARPARRPHFTP